MLDELRDLIYELASPAAQLALLCGEHQDLVVAELGQVPGLVAHLLTLARVAQVSTCTDMDYEKYSVSPASSTSTTPGTAAVLKRGLTPMTSATNTDGPNQSDTPKRALVTPRLLSREDEVQKGEESDDDPGSDSVCVWCALIPHAPPEGTPRACWTNTDQCSNADGCWLSDEERDHDVESAAGRLTSDRGLYQGGPLHVSPGCLQSTPKKPMCSAHTNAPVRACALRGQDCMAMTCRRVGPLQRASKSDLSPTVQCS